ncbi:hypothetical protein EJ02DRAFT_470096 [Clathrospora elynae]|uniref:tRNA-splicing endonuclease subunit Sen2 n=1 Tax=Clathrospora elynae TaxID=706981 RepID=A0A6A5SHN3_9PLEO|nr:hypothetical protein EJ02DRAFT_470096 [Clathrospora elynae]
MLESRRQAGEIRYRRYMTPQQPVPSDTELQSSHMSEAIQPEQSAPKSGSPENGALPRQDKAANGGLRKPRPRRPNYHEIHAKSLPLDVYPLPAFVPHNPISVVRIAINLLSHSIWPPKSHRVVHRAYYSPETRSVHVTDQASIRALWEHGFFGKGSLSRSEPQWLVAEKRKRGAEASKTSTEVTQSRREERKQFKLERAKAQREAIEQQLRDEGKLSVDGSLDQVVDDEHVPALPLTIETGDNTVVDLDALVPAVDKTSGMLVLAEHDTEPVPEVKIQDLEHLQLTPEEAFFLTYAIGALDVVEVDNTDSAEPSESYSIQHLMRLYCAHAVSTSKITEETLIEPDNPFLLKYVVYHHFRSLGWVVRSGVKFAVDYLLYIRGPAFTHAEFAIMIVPSYSAPYWTEHAQEKKSRDWWWLHRVNRVQSQVMKTLLLVYVEVPEPWDNATEDGSKLDVGSVLKAYKVREFVFKRWSPSRNRD